MKKLFIALLLTSVCFLTSCTRRVGSSTEILPENKSVSSTIITTVTTAEVKRTTVSAVTEKKDSAVTTAATTDISEKEIPDEVYFETYDSVEVYDEVSLSEFITDTNVTLLEPDKKIGTKKLGRKGVKVRFEYEGEEYEGKLGFDVIDTTAPVALNMGWNPYAKLNEPFNLDSIVGYADNCDRSPELTYSGEVDTSEIGNYPISVTVTDDSGNSTSWDMNVLVVSEIPAPEDNNPRVNFTDFVDYYCYENVSYGIDVSAWQTNVDYEKVKEQGCEFVIMRMGYYYGEIVMDDYYMQNMENASAAGLDIGVYFYTTANTEDEAREQARWIVEQLDGRELDYPVAFDWEEWSRFQQYGMNVYDLNQIFEAFCDELEKHGYTGMLYSSKNFLNNFWTNRNNRSVWLAHYVDETDYEGQFAIWQASAYGRMDGIEGDVDMNIRVNDVPLF